MERVKQDVYEPWNSTGFTVDVTRFKANVPEHVNMLGWIYLNTLCPVLCVFIGF